MKPTKILDLTPEYVIECFKKNGLKPIQNKLEPGASYGLGGLLSLDRIGQCCALGAVAVELGADKNSGNEFYIANFLNQNIEDMSGSNEFVRGFDQTLSCWVSYSKDLARKMPDEYKDSPPKTLGARIAIACAEEFYPDKAG